MAYGRDNQDDLEAQMMRQMDPAQQSPLPALDTQPVGPPTLLDGGADTPAPAASPAASPSPNLAAATKTAAQNGYTDIAGAEGLKTGGYMGNLEGFNTNAWGSGERGSNTQKNSFGKIASRYDPTKPGATKQLMSDPDFAAMFPDAQMIDHPNQDQIDFDGPGPGAPVDVIRAAESGGAGQGWQWGVQDGGGGTGNLDITSMVQNLGGNPLDDIQKQIDAMSNGQDEQSLIQQLMSQQGV